MKKTIDKTELFWLELNFRHLLALKIRNHYKPTHFANVLALSCLDAPIEQLHQFVKLNPEFTP